jgi:NRPS condensation-like uncharacterized protein
MTENRKLAPIEQSMEIFNRHGGSFNILTISRIKGLLNEETLRQALDLIQFRHPRLKSCIVGNLDNPCFQKGVNKIPFRVVYKQHHHEWQEIAVEELNQPIESDKCLARAVLISINNENTNYLITTLHHAISDGLSTVKLHSEILTYCHKIICGELDDNIKTLSPLSAIPPITELLIPKSLQGYKAIIKSIFFLFKFVSKVGLYPSKYLKFEKYVPIELRRCGIVQRKLNKKITTKLVELCRKENTTVQGALCAAMLSTAAKKIRGGDETNLCISCASAIDLRKHLTPQVSHEHLGLLTSGISSFHTLKANISFWDLAREVKQKLELGLKNKEIFSAVLVSKIIYDFLLARPDKTPMTVMVTNIGQVDIKSDYGSLQLEDISFVPSQAVFGGVFAVAVTTFKLTMTLNFMFSEPSISQETIETLATDVVCEIIAHC